MSGNFNAALAEAFYILIGVIFILTGLRALGSGGAARARPAWRQMTTALFWFILAFTFIAGPRVPRWITGLCVVAVAVITACGGVRQSSRDTPPPEETRRAADRAGAKVFIPPLGLAVTAALVATFLAFAVSANNAIGVSAAAALIAAFVITRCPPKYAAIDGARLMDGVGPAGILPQLLAALGALFTAAGVGALISRGVSSVIPEHNRLAAVAAYCGGMALFTIIMGNGFAAFSVITAGIGFPFLILQGADPVVVGALGLTAGYCGTLCTPMAANFNIMPAALLETKDKYVIIKSQLPLAGVLLAVHVVLMYALAF